MIARYTRKACGHVWTDKNRFLTYLKVEFAALKELSRTNVLSPKDWKKLNKELLDLIGKGGVSVQRIQELEKEVNHDVIAFTRAVTEKLGPVGQRFFHYGLTSSDVVDTSLSLMMIEASAEITKSLNALLVQLKKKAKSFRSLATIGRTHGVWAEPTSFGLKFLSWYAELSRCKRRFESAIREISYGKLSGAVGVGLHFPPKMEEKILRSLGLDREPVATQVLPRDRHAVFLGSIALMGSTLERIATEIRHLQRSEVGEVMEPFPQGSRGSSAMPHKRNPVGCENIVGVARILRSMVNPALENIALWHERDISHSSVERVHLPDATILLDYALHRMAGIVRGLQINRKQVEKNFQEARVFAASGRILLELVKKGASRDEAYSWIQGALFKAKDNGLDAFDALGKHPQICEILSVRELQKIIDYKKQLQSVDEIYRSVWSNYD